MDLGIDNQIEWIFNLVRIVIPLIIIFIIFTVLYSVAPNVKTKLRSVIPGAIFTSIIWLHRSFAFGYYISNFSNYSKTYGSLAGIIILFLWLYITSFIIIIGAEINAIIHQRKVIAGHTPEEAAIKHDDNNENHYNENTTYEYYEDSKDVDISNEDDTHIISIINLRRTSHKRLIILKGESIDRCIFTFAFNNLLNYYAGTHILLLVFDLVLLIYLVCYLHEFYCFDGDMRGACNLLVRVSFSYK